MILWPTSLVHASMSFFPSQGLGSSLSFFCPCWIAQASRSYLYTTNPVTLTCLSRYFCPLSRISVTEWLPSAYGLGSGKSGGGGRSSLISVSATSALAGPVELVGEHPTRAPAANPRLTAGTTIDHRMERS